MLTFYESVKKIFFIAKIFIDSTFSRICYPDNFIQSCLYITAPGKNFFGSLQDTFLPALIHPNFHKPLLLPFSPKNILPAFPMPQFNLLYYKNNSPDKNKFCRGILSRLFLFFIWYYL